MKYLHELAQDILSTHEVPEFDKESILIMHPYNFPSEKFQQTLESLLVQTQAPIIIFEEYGEMRRTVDRVLGVRDAPTIFVRTDYATSNPKNSSWEEVMNYFSSKGVESMHLAGSHYIKEDEHSEPHGCLAHAEREIRAFMPTTLLKKYTHGYGRDFW
jgi:hypothetical protein